MSEPEPRSTGDEYRLDAFAAAALVGLLAHPNSYGSDARIARLAYDHAVAMEAERARRLA